VAGADWTNRAVDAQTWPDMAALFEGKGGPKSCWCMMWRNTEAGKAAPSRANDRRAAVQTLAQSGGQIGILGYDQGIPIAWCSIAPRATFGAGLGGFGSDARLWSLTCFFIRSSHRNQGGFAALLNAAETFARE
jgi:GNAT superfamily N-acetyltransferase